MSEDINAQLLAFLSGHSTGELTDLQLAVRRDRSVKMKSVNK
jgi:hypothetical protein